jgi:hypothetical protein
VTEQATKRYVMVFGVISILSFLTVFLSDYTGCANAATCGIGDTRVLSAGLTGNEDGGDSDTRVESQNDEYAWMVNAGVDAVLIGQETPDAGEKFTVNGTSKFKGASSFTTITATGGTITGITDLALADGGTGASTASAARTNLGVAIGSDVQAWDADLDTVSGLTKTDGNIIVADGLNWTVESGATARTSLGLGSLATSSTVDNGDWSGTDLAVVNGGTGASTVGDARTNLGVAIGSDVQAWDADLDTFAALAKTDGNFIVGTGVGWTIENGSVARTSLGLGSLATLSNINGSYWNGTDLALADGGTGSSTASGARTNLGVAIGSDVQAYDAGLNSIAGLTTAADRMIYTTAADTYAVTNLTLSARQLLDDVSASAMRTTLGVDAAGTDNSTDVTLAGVPDYITIASQTLTLALIDLATDVTGALPVANGGTGATSLANLITLSTDTVGNYIATITDSSGIDISGSGSEGAAVTVSLDLSELADMTAAVNGGLDELILLDSGSQRRKLLSEIALSAFNNDSGFLSSVNDSNWSGTDLAVANGGTGSSTASGARTNLGLGSLATQSNVDNGDWSGTDLSVANGGTGTSSLTDHYVLVGSGTGAITPVTPGTSGWVLTSNGTSADPTFQAASAGSAIATGTYTGNGATSYAITGLGFAPKFVMIIRQASGTGSANVTMTSDTLVDDDAAGQSIQWGTAAQFYNDGIISMDADGFTVDDRGFDNDPNKSGQVYNYIAWG